MTERSFSRMSPEQPKRHIDTLPLDSPDIHYLYDYHDPTLIVDMPGKNVMLANAHKKYGEENVRVSLAMQDGKHVAIPDRYGIYVDAKKWAELNPSKADS